MSSIFPQYAFKQHYITPPSNTQAEQPLAQKPSNAGLFTPPQQFAFAPTTGVTSPIPVSSPSPTSTMFEGLPTRLNNKTGLQDIEDYSKLPGFSIASGSRLNIMA